MGFLLLLWLNVCGCFLLADPPELGKVKWLRDLEEAQQRSIQTNKAIFILFQEVPGCMTCKNYGSNVLSHPLVVEAIETYFVPLCIYNNKSGKDASSLAKFGEPAWNNPVIRIVDHQFQDVVKRLSGNYSVFGITSQINAFLIKKGIVIPEYLRLLEEEAKANETGKETIYMQMYCFWSGEKLYAKLKGIVSTNAGYMQGNEVVEIEYDPRMIHPDEIIRYGKKHQIADKIYLKTQQKISEQILISEATIFKPDAQNKYYLYHTDYKYIPMMPIQATRSNSLLSEKQFVDHLFSPRQLCWLGESKQRDSKQNKNLISTNILKAWYP
ncbi:MAG: thioredoxin family protein [Saprospiraceae bacterium]|nr:thioredoxin family protein [Saprospiraceae bacterium]